MKALWTVLPTLALFPALPPSHSHPVVANLAALCSPWVGLGLGSLLVGIQRMLLPHLGNALAALFIVALWVLLMAGQPARHCIGVLKALRGPQPPQPPDRRSREARAGAAAWLTVGLGGIAKVALLASLGEPALGRTLLLAPMAARWMPLLVHHSLRGLRRRGDEPDPFQPLHPFPVLLASLAVLGIASWQAGECGFHLLLGVWSSGVLVTAAGQRKWTLFPGPFWGVLVEVGEVSGLLWGGLLMGFC